MDGFGDEHGRGSSIYDYRLLALAAGMFLLFWPSLGKNPSRGQKTEYEKRTDAFYDGAFHTLEDFQLIVETEKKSENKKAELTPQGKISINKITELPKADIKDLTVTWFGHSTSLLQIHGMNVFIDPVFSEYSSPVGFTGAKRMAEVPMTAELPWRNNQTLWSGYFLQDEYHKVYYTVDTGYGEFFKEIRVRYGEPELVLSEDGQYDPEWPDCHMSPQEVLNAAQDVETEWVIPVHWAGFVLSRHAWDDPAEQLTTLAEESNVSVATPRIGEIKPSL